MHLVEIPQTTDGQLIVRIAGGDRGAFDELHGRYQDAFVAIWRSARTYDPTRGRGAAWLYAVARNAITDGLRRTPEPVAELEDGPGNAPDPAEEAEASWTAWRVHRALETLPEHERPVIELAYWGGLSQSEVAERLSIPLGTVKTRTRSALSRLADALEEELR
jgi:RNA polymerase sigma-70 factor, ECF subfamily